MEMRAEGRSMVFVVSLARVSPTNSCHLPPSHHFVASVASTACLQETFRDTAKFSWRLDRHKEGHSMDDEDANAPLSLRDLNNITRETDHNCATETVRIRIILDIMLVYIDPAERQTRQGETIIHLSIKNKNYMAGKYLLKNVEMGELMYLGNHNGHHIYRIAPLEMLPKMTKYLFSENQGDAVLWKKSTTRLKGIASPSSLVGRASYYDNIREGVSTDEELDLNQLQMLVTHLVKENKQRSQKLQERKGHIIPRSGNNQSHQSDLEVRDVDELRKAFSTLAMLAVLLAFVTIISVLRPPRALLIASESSSLACMIFTYSTVVTLILSLCSLTLSISVLVSKQRPTHKQLAVNQAVILLTSLSMAVGFSSGTWMGLPLAGRKRFFRLAMSSVQIGSVGLVTIGSIAIAINRGWLH